jgi:hypothetical protein
MSALIVRPDDDLTACESAAIVKSNALLSDQSQYQGALPFPIRWMTVGRVIPGSLSL